MAYMKRLAEHRCCPNGQGIMAFDGGDRKCRRVECQEREINQPSNNQHGKCTSHAE
jgi:hypothetical protein